MIMRFSAPDKSDRRVAYAAAYLENKGLLCVSDSDHADFVLLGVNPDKSLLSAAVPVLAGNVCGSGIYDYTKDECFAVTNAYLTAEGALSLAVSESERSLINSRILIAGYGRIGKALVRYLSPFTQHITVCARSAEQRALAMNSGCEAIGFEGLDCGSFDYIFNTVPHPVFNREELATVRRDTLLIELASFPGGIDVHMAKAKELRLLQARGLPSRFSPAAAGAAVGEAVYKITKEVIT